MFGAFSPGDSLRIYRLQRRGISLDLPRDLIQPHRPLWEAWLAFLTQQAMGQPTFVLDDPLAGEAFVQVRYRPHQAAADIVGLAPALETQEGAAQAWCRLLDGACVEAAGQGIRRVFANLPAAGAELDAFQQAGFAVYAAEDVFRLVSPDGATAPAPRRRLARRPAEPAPTELQRLPDGDGPPDLIVRPQQPEDWPALQKLCVAIIPQRVRQAEGGIALPSGWEKSCARYVLPTPEGDDLLGVVTLCTGGQVHWLRVLLHPEARHIAPRVVAWGLDILAQQPAKTVYCNVRQYENGVREALDGAGFEHCTSRALLVKYTLAWITGSVPEAAPALKGSAEPVPPSLHIYGEREPAAPDNGLRSGAAGADLWPAPGINEAHGGSA